MKAQNKLTLVLTILFLVILTLGSLLIYHLNTKGHECLADPFIYETKRISEASGFPIQCQCIGITIGESPTMMWSEQGHDQ